MPIPPSIHLSSARRPSPYLESYPSLYNGYSPASSSSSLNSIPSLPTSSRKIYSPGLPPAAPIRRYTPSRPISYTSGFDVPSERKPVLFHPRPLRSITVYSDSPSRDGTIERSVTRSPSPTPSNYSVRSNNSFRSTRSSSLYCPPRRTFPQTYERDDSVADEDEDKDDSSVVFDANITFVLGCKAKLRQNVTAVPAHQDTQTASNVLSNKISNFLARTDHVMDEWKGMGHKEDDTHSLRMRKNSGKFVGRSRSATNIMIKGFQYFSRASSCSRSSVGRESSVGGDTTDCEEVGEG